jgi:GalNAc-alpha-(1->4)-GalNAc-alpha-(1->3)-diNAcBac-PP-undecaprenol alpha-1,4-N-acetyl-D-galactosaminyltransferase
MIIGLAIPSLNSGGAERVITTLANYWANKNKEVHLFVFSNSDSFYKLHPSIKIHCFEQIPSKNPIAKFTNILKPVKSYKTTLMEVKPSVVISFMTIVNIFSIKACTDLNIPVIISERNNVVDTPQKFHWNFLRKANYKKASAIVLQTKRSLSCFSQLNIKLPTIQQVIFNPLSEECQQEVNLVGKEDLIISIGRFDDHKQQDLLLKALSTIDLKNWKVILVGEGKNLETVKQLSRDLNLENKVSFLGKRKDVASLLEKASIFTLTSKSEGFPNALCEALAKGCACVSFDCEFGPGEIINKENGILVEAQNIEKLAEAINKLIVSAEKRVELSSNGMKIKEDLSVEKVIAKWENVIESVI